MALQLLGATALQGTSAFLDLRKIRMGLYCGSTENFNVVAKGNSFQKMQLVAQATSGRMLLPCTGYDE